MNYHTTAEYYEQRARRQRNRTMRARYTAQAERYRALAESESQQGTSQGKTPRKKHEGGGIIKRP